MQGNYDNLQAVTRQSLAEQARVKLRESLLNGEFPFGMRLSEEKLAEAFQISRTPLRQALQQLAQEGLLEKIPAGGFRPSYPLRQDVEDAIEVRAFVESLLTKRATVNVSEAELLQLEAYSRMFGVAKKTRNIIQLREVNSHIHMMIRQLARSSLLVVLLNSLDSRIEPVVRLYIDPNSVDTWTVRGHTDIIKHMRNREPELAMEAMRQHVLCSGKVVLKHMK